MSRIGANTSTGPELRGAGTPIEGVPGVPRQGTLGLTAPGLVPSPPELSEGAKVASELGRALGLTTQLAATADAIDARQQRLDERAARDKELLDRGQSAQHLAVDLPRLSDAIQRGELSPLDDEDDRAFVERVLFDTIEDGHSDAYKNERLHRGSAALSNALSNRREALRKQGEAQDINLLRDGSLGKGASDITEAVERAQALAPDLTELQAKHAIAIPALNYAAENNLPGAFDEAVAALGEGFTAEIADARARLLSTQNADQLRRTRALSETLEVLEFNDATPVQRLAAVDQAVADGLPAGVGNTYKNAIEREIAQAENTALKKFAVQEENRIRQEAVTSTIQSLIQGDGVADIEDISVTLPDGRDVNIPRAAQIREALDEHFASLDELPRKYPQITPEAVFNNKIDVLSRAGITYEPFKRQLDQGWSSLLGNLDRINNDEGAPPAVTRGFELWQSMRVNSTVRAAHTSDQAQIFYTNLETALEVNDGNMEAALLQASKATSRPSVQSLPLREFDNEESLRDLFRAGFWKRALPGDSGSPREVVNASDVIAVADRVGQFFMDAGMGADRAVESTQQYIQDNFIPVNGSLVKISPNAIKHEYEVVTGKGVAAVPFADIFDALASKYAGAYSDIEGVDASDLTLTQVDEGVYALAYKGTGALAENVTADAAFGDSPELRQIGVFDARDFALAAKQIAESEAYKAAVKKLRKDAFFDKHFDFSAGGKLIPGGR